MPPATSDVAFTPIVKAVQERRGSRAGYARLEEKGGWRNRVTPELAAFIAGRDSLYLATASSAGQPYIQHRGGPAASSRFWTSRRWALPISAATANTSRPATSPRTIGRSSS